MATFNDWELEQRAFHAAAIGAHTTATTAELQQLIRDLWKAFCEKDEELDLSERHAVVLMEALAEIKATNDGDSDQPIGKILEGCVEEIAEIKRIHAVREARLEENLEVDVLKNFPYRGMRFPQGRKEGEHKDA